MEGQVIEIMMYSTATFVQLHYQQTGDDECLAALNKLNEAQLKQTKEGLRYFILKDNE